MCGIFFLCDNSDIDLYGREKRIKSSFEKGRHRGPDNSNIEYIPSIGAWIGFHRLSINGLGEEGNQPLRSHDCILICNGEVYNHTGLYDTLDISNNTHSDCNIILDLYVRYGIEYTLQSLDGVFSFVLIDFRESEPKIIIARDPMGVRPLYIMNNFSGKSQDHVFGVASELIALKQSITNEHDRVEIKQFPPASYLELGVKWLDSATPSIDYDNMQFKTYWTIPHPMSMAFSIDINDNSFYYEDILATLFEGVYKRVKNTDRPLGCLLSGGLDSSIVAALTKRILGDKPLRTYSIGLEGSVDLEKAKLVARHIGSEHHEFVVDSDMFIKAVPDVIKDISSYDTTTVRASVGNYIVGQLISQLGKDIVILNGDGADEVMGGYLYFKKAKNDLEFDKECRRLVGSIHHFDVLRSDRCISSHGLEPRTPFLDKSFVSTYFSIPSKVRFDSTLKQEKLLLREAIHKHWTGILPDEVLWRKKEAFSDGVSAMNQAWYSAFDDIDTYKCSFPVENDINPPMTNEQRYYRSVFDQIYPDCSSVIPYFWMPKFVEASDASARTLSFYEE